MDATHGLFELLSNLSSPRSDSTPARPTARWKSPIDSTNRRDMCFCHKHPSPPFWCSSPARKRQIWYRQISETRKHFDLRVNIVYTSLERPQGIDFSAVKNRLVGLIRCANSVGGCYLEYFAAIRNTFIVNAWLVHAQRNTVEYNY